ncbi:unnamed protein product [Microthlaspi erraticum]|uniref:Uncharacterized protein n=1 Tax=Microthlaspi erraticum TaxID=1685480 RepID=A0A6D2I7S5_9BRAS|nr:unnamed protein product [Microthlaspi erraticum]
MMEKLSAKHGRDTRSTEESVLITDTLTSRILSIFYDGVNWDYMNALNAASNGDFMTKSKEGAFELIENLAASSSNKNAEYDRTAQQKSVHFVDENDDTPISQEFGGEEDEDDQMEVNYVNGQAFCAEPWFQLELQKPSEHVLQEHQRREPSGSGLSASIEPEPAELSEELPNSFQEKTFAPNQNRSQGGNQQKAQFSNSNNLQVHRTTRTMSLRV